LPPELQRFVAQHLVPRVADVRTPARLNELLGALVRAIATLDEPAIDAGVASHLGADVLKLIRSGGEGGV
jgi:hypothetical protein